MRLTVGEPLTFEARRIHLCQYRPFVQKNVYYDHVIVHRVYQQDRAFPPNVIDGNRSISFLCVSSNQPLAALAVDKVFDLCLLKTGNGGTFGVSRYRYSSDRERVDNITDWALDQFRAHYERGKTPKHHISKDAIFHYVYGVLHDPIYREKYVQNLKREFPRIPFYADFWCWAEWGEKLS